MMDAETFTNISLTLMIILSLWTTILNTTCIFVIVRSKQLLKRPSTILILNLLFVHWLQGVLVFPFYTAKKANVGSSHWLGIVCDGFRFTYMVTFYAAISAVFLISVDRLLATCFVLKYREMVSHKKVLLTIGAAWLYVIVLCLIPFKFHPENIASSPHDEISFRNNSSLPTSNNTFKKVSNNPCSYQQSSLWTILMLSLNCAVPYVVIVIFYQQIVSHINAIQKRAYDQNHIHAKRPMSIISQTSAPSMKQIVLRDERPRSILTTIPHPNNDRVSTWKKNEQKHMHSMTRMTVILVMSYFLFWLPSVIYFVLLKLCFDKCFTSGYHDSMTETCVAFFMKFLAYLDAVSAPIIYCVMSGEFRKHVPCGKYKQKSMINNVH